MTNRNEEKLHERFDEDVENRLMELIAEKRYLFKVEEEADLLFDQLMNYHEI